MKNKILAWLLALCLLAGVLPVRTGAAESDTVRFQDEHLYDAVEGSLRTLEGALRVSFTGSRNSLTMDFPKGELEKVTELVLNNREIESLSGLGKFTGLKSLNISNNKLTTLQELSALTGLETLSAYGCRISDVSPLAGLAGLRTLSLAKNKLVDTKEGTCVTAALRSLTALEDLDLSHNMLRFTAGLEDLHNLRTLDLYDNAVRDLGGLSGLDQLEVLSLGENNESSQSGIAHMEALDTLTALRSLNFDKNGTAEIMEHLGGMTQMETLSLVQNGITDLTPLSAMPNLRELILFGNKVKSVEAILCLSNLEELNLENNGGDLQTLNGILTADGSLVWPRLRKLGIAGCYNWNLRIQPETGALFQMAEEGNLELTYRYDRIYEKDWSHLPHTDADGTTWVSYDDFLARAEEGYDDYNAIRNAHNFANACGCDEVRAAEGKTYHIYNPYDYAVTARTNIDWHNATFVLHDEDIEEKYGRYWPLLLVSNTVEADCVTIENPGWTIDQTTKKLEPLRDVVAALNAKGYERYLCIVQNDNVRQFIRFGVNANSGDVQQDRFLLDRECNLLNDVMWDFEQITSVELVPIPTERGYVRNATFISNAPESGSETPNSRGGGKQIYFNRNIQWRKSANMEISNIRHIVTSDDLCGSYNGLLLLSNCAEMDLHDLTLFARKYINSGRSTYDLVPTASVNVRFANLESNDITNGSRWGVMGSCYLKDVLFEHCTMNRIDAHQGIYNLTIRDCTLGCHSMTLTGKGTLNVLRTTMISEAMITLRPDYGSTWTGDVNLLDCTLRYNGRWAEKVFNFTFGLESDGSPHWFGYEVHMPNLYIDNLTVDNQYNTSRTTLDVVEDWDTATLSGIPASYWPRSMQLNSVRFINSEGLSQTPRVQLIANPAEGLDGNYAVTDVRFHLDGESGEDGENGESGESGENRVSREDGESGEDITRDLRGETTYQTTQPVTVTALPQPSTENRLSLTRDGVPVFTDLLLEEPYQETWTEPGLYCLTAASLDTGKGAAGESVWTVRITGTEPTVSAVILDAAGETELGSIPEGAFVVRASVYAPQPLPEGCCLALAVYDACGQMKAWDIQPLAAGETAQGETAQGETIRDAVFAVENADGRTASGKLFLLNADLTPLASAAGF